MFDELRCFLCVNAHSNTHVLMNQFIYVSTHTDSVLLWMHTC